MADAVTKSNIHGKLPLKLEGFPCPICGRAAHLVGVNEWGADDGKIVGVEYECESEPDIDDEGWRDWFKGHFSMPYVDWLPWETRMMRWLNKHYYYRDEEQG